MLLVLGTIHLYHNASVVDFKQQNSIYALVELMLRPNVLNWKSIKMHILNGLWGEIWSVMTRLLL